MAEQKKENLKGRTIRTSEESYEKFRQIAQEQFENQGQCFAALIHLYELEQGKTVLGERKMEIENFQMHINALLQMFVQSLQMNEDAEDRVRAGIQATLDMKEKHILQLQKERIHLKEQLEEMDAKYQEFTLQLQEQKQKSQSQKENDQMTISQLTQAVKDKNDMIALLDGQKKELQNQLQEVHLQDKKIRALEQSLSGTEQEKISLKNQLALKEQLHAQEIEKMNRQLELEKEKYAFDLEKSLMEQQKDLQLSWEEEKMEYNRKLELYQMKYVTALERIDKFSSKKE
jgi:Cft2 family RNA processing exonuclease